MFKKIISVIVALSIALSCLCVPSFATPLSLPQTVSRFFSELWDLTDDYDSGKISKSEFFEKFKASMIRFGINYVGEGSCFKDILDVIEFCGIDVPEEWKAWFYENNEVEKDDSLLENYGAACAVRRIRKSDGYLMSITIFFGDYGVIYDTWASVYGSVCSRKLTDYYHNKDAVISSSADKMQCTNYNEDSSDYYADTSFYGDWRYSDGSSADDNISDLPDKDVPSYDDDSVSEDDVFKFLRDLLQDLMLKFPDMSTIEGLLRAILAKCTDIENRIGDGGSGMTSDELKPLLDQAVLALTLQNKTDNDALLKSNEQLLNELINIRKILQGFDSDEEIDNDTSNSILQGLISSLSSGLTRLLGFGFDDDDVSEIIQICITAGSVGRKLMSGIVDVIAFMGALVPFSIIKTLIENTFNIMFNKNAPADLTFTLDNTTYTFLSASFLDIPIVAGSLAIVKGLVSVMIIYIWLKWARKFFVNLM